jgi:flagellar assembly protein FliH
MSRWSPEPGAGAGAGTATVVHAAAAATVPVARFDVPLGGGLKLPAELAERLRSQAQAAGYAAGWAEGRRAADEATREARAEFAAQAQAAAAQAEARTGQVLRAVADAVARFEQRSAPALADLSAQLVEAAFALAEAIVGRELATATEPGRDALMRALLLAPAGRAVLVRMHPEDAATLPSTSTVDGRDVVVVADPSLGRGDAVLDCDATTVDARIGAAVERAKAALL